MRIQSKFSPMSTSVHEYVWSFWIKNFFKEFKNLFDFFSRCLEPRCPPNLAIDTDHFDCVFWKPFFEFFLVGCDHISFFLYHSDKLTEMDNWSFFLIRPFGQRFRSRHRTDGSLGTQVGRIVSCNDIASPHLDQIFLNFSCKAKLLFSEFTCC